LTDYLCTTFLSTVLTFTFTQMQLQTIVCYGYIYDSIFITKFLKSNANYTASRSAPNPQ